jgi:hypothetical protein
MSVSRNGPPASADGRPGGFESAVELARWRQAHEIHSLRDMLSTYRQWATELTAENARLRDEIAILSATPPRAHLGTGGRTRGDCPA